MLPIESPWMIFRHLSVEFNIALFFQVFDIKRFSIGIMLKINSISGLVDVTFPSKK